MEWINSVLFEHSAIQAVVVMALIIFSGLALGRIRVAGISLGVTFVFFMGIFAGYLGLSIDHQMLNYAESFGLVLSTPSVCKWDRVSSVRSSKAD